MPTERLHGTRHRDSGAVAVEAALVSMLLLTLLAGIVESSFLLKDWLTVSAAARAGARMGASEPRNANFAEDSADQVSNAISDLNKANTLEVWVYRATYATGLPVSGSFLACTTDCVKFTWPIGGTKFTRLSGVWDWSSQNACAADPSRNALGVYVKYKHSAPLGFFFNNAIVSESTVMRLEPYADTPCKHP